MSKEMKWWGYLHSNGNVQAKPYMDKRDIEDARKSPFVLKVIKPFMASSREEALRKVQFLTLD